jgi:DNA-binding LacI/PurR family transcriptional regulator
VLNNKADQHGIRKDTQEKVLALARQMGFFSTPEEKSVTISPVDEKPGVIGMIVPSLNDPFVLGITPYLQKAFQSIGLGFSIITKDPDDQRYDRMIRAFSKFFSGLILVSEAADDITIRVLRSTDYPFILLEKTIKTGRLNTVNTDVTAGVQLVVDHLQKLGYKNIIIATDRRSAKYDTHTIDKFISSLGRIQQMNKPIIIEFERSLTDNEIDFEQIDQFLRPPYRADIILALHSDLVYPLMSLFRKKKLRVPQDIALISMEDGIGFDLMFTPVTCLRKPLSGLAIKAANMIWSEVKNAGRSKFKRQVNIAPGLVIRNSCGTL